MPSQSESGAAPAWTTLGKQLLKNVEKQPGWVYVLSTVYLATSLVRFPSRFSVLGSQISVPREIWIVAVAFAAYAVGDALDKITFKKPADVGGKRVWRQRYKPLALEEAKGKARDCLCVQSGVYDVSMRLLDAAHDAKFSVHFVNEFSKFIRSLIIPGLLLGVFVAFGKYPFCIAAILSLMLLAASLGIAYGLYPYLKMLHITNLYRIIPKLLGETNEDDVKRLCIVSVDEINFFFWDDLFVASARKAPVATIAAELQ